MSALDICRATYDETQAFYAELAPSMGSAALGYRILYGPPVENAPVLFMGYQPGGRAVDAGDGLAAGEHTNWPALCDYATASWPLAKRMRQIWGASFLERCTGLNAIFFRARSVRDWNSLNGPLRSKMESFSRERAERIVRALAPQCVVVIGLGTFDRLLTGTPDLVGANKILTKRGMLWGVPSIGIVHLSGARLSRDDLGGLAAYFAEPAG